MKKHFLIFGFVTLLIPIIYFVYINFFYFNDDWKERTTPLSDENIKILCDNFNIKSTDSLCDYSKGIYAPDFYEIIRDAFRPYEAYGIPSSESATFDEVEEKIGVFKYECNDVATTGDGFSFFRCWYDLHGDREFIIGIIYSYPDNAVFRINTPMGYDGE